MAMPLLSMKPKTCCTYWVIKSMSLPTGVPPDVIITLVTANQSLSDRIRAYLTSIAKMQTDPKLPGGCFVCSSTSEIGASCFPAEASKTVTKINAYTKLTLIEFFNAEKTQGNISKNQSASLMANYIMTIQFGMAMMASDGVGIEALIEVINYSVSNF